MAKNVLTKAVGAAIGTETDSLDAFQKSEDGIRILSEGAEYAKSIIDKSMGQNKTLIQLMIHVAKLDTRAEAVTFVDGYKSECEAQAKKLAKDADGTAAVEMAQQHVTRMNRVIRAVFGWNKRNPETKKLEHTYAKGYDKGKDDHAKGRESTLKILEGKGAWMAKYKALPSESGDSRPDDPILSPTQRRIAVAKEMTAGTDALAKVLGVSGEDVKEEKAKRTSSVEILIAGIKMVPESALGEVVNAVINRLMASADETNKELGINFRDHVKASATSQPRVAKRVKEQAIAKAATTTEK